MLAKHFDANKKRKDVGADAPGPIRMEFALHSPIVVEIGGEVAEEEVVPMECEELSAQEEAILDLVVGMVEADKKLTPTEIILVDEVISSVTQFVDAAWEANYVAMSDWILTNHVLFRIRRVESNEGDNLKIYVQL